MKRLMIALIAGAISGASAETATDDAIGLYGAGKFAEAEAALRQIVAADPGNAAACHYLGKVLRHGGDDHALRQAEPWLEKAVALEPGNPAYLGEYGGACLLIADREHSIRYALRGRDAMEKVIAIDPDSLKARDALMQYYAEAPWPLGSSSRALAQAGEIGRRDSTQGVQACLRLIQIFERKGDLSAGRDACRAALKLDPANPAILAARTRLESP